MIDRFIAFEYWEFDRLHGAPQPVSGEAEDAGPAR
jgi:hypothetical protein